MQIIYYQRDIILQYHIILSRTISQNHITISYQALLHSVLLNFRWYYFGPQKGKAQFICFCGFLLRFFYTQFCRQVPRKKGRQYVPRGSGGGQIRSSLEMVDTIQSTGAAGNWGLEVKLIRIPDSSTLRPLMIFFGASKQVANLTPHDIWRILRVKLIPSRTRTYEASKFKGLNMDTLLGYLKRL